jgi:hypothetical protein
VPRSSISSSERPLLAGLLAVALVLLAQAPLLWSRGLWELLAGSEKWGRATVQERLLELRAALPGSPRVVAIGDSRVFAGLSASRLRALLPGVEIENLGTPGIGAYAVRALADAAIAARADAVVLFLSEFDTHRPLRLGPWPRPTPGAIADVVAEAGPAFAWRQRVALYRMALASALPLYSARSALRDGALAGAARFEVADLAGPSRLRDPAGPIALWGGPRHEVEAAARREVFDVFPPATRRENARFQLAQLGEIAPGPHVAVQMGLLRRAVRLLREAGAEVVIVEPPLHPATRDLYDPRLRGDFLDFARALARDPGVRFVPIEASGPFAESDFADLVHVARLGADKLLRATARALHEAGISPPAAPHEPKPGS